MAMKAARSTTILSVRRGNDVALDMVQRIEANLLMRNYGGFLSTPGQKGKRIKGRQY